MKKEKLPTDKKNKNKTVKATFGRGENKINIELPIETAKKVLNLQRIIMENRKDDSMPEYSEHIMQNWEWSERYRSLMGKEAYWKYVGDVYGLLLSMQLDSFFSIEKNVKPENIDLFIKVCCMFIQEQFASGHRRDFCHSFNADCTEMRCISLQYSGKNSNKNNIVTT